MLDKLKICGLVLLLSTQINSSSTYITQISKLAKQKSKPEKPVYKNYFFQPDGTYSNYLYNRF